MAHFHRPPLQSIEETLSWGVKLYPNYFLAVFADKSHDNMPRSRLSNIRAKTGNTKDTSPHQPTIQFGLVASGNVVMKSGRDRDNIASQEDVIAFEMEGAGVWDNFPCLIIKGVCDYA